ncbi:GrpB family protein [Acinetobacter sp. HY1485]|uniref:GrpB family protein n=1 Tax=Acinetobacter sp. HY1485 TaxID=2970918 RepID=UPI0022B9B6BE|nr:GrpB family protein [Acinetobacter sp. HY1485]
MELIAPDVYQPRLKLLFKNYKKHILNLLPYATVEHIGSSAISNAYSKGDLDILISVSSQNFEVSIEKLKTLNFIEQQNTLRTHQLYMLVSEKKNEDVAFQVVTDDSPYLCFLTFRNILNTHQHLVRDYNQLKIACIHLPEDKYREIKSRFIEDVLHQYDVDD